MTTKFFHRNLNLDSTMFVTLQGENYTVELCFILAQYPLYDKDNSGKFRSFSMSFEIQLDRWKYI